MNSFSRIFPKGGALSLLSIAVFSLGSLTAQTTHKNVLFLMADDFNFWNGLSGYYPLVKTPNIDQLARKGVYFSEGNCSSPVCNPSRNSLWSGFRPSTSGIMGNSDGYIRTTTGFENITTMHQYFKENGYYVLGGGKLYHSGAMGGATTDPENWTELYKAGTGSPGGSYYKYNSPSDALFSWGAGVYDLSTANDTKLANFIADKITNYDKSANKDQPFFIGCGFFRPHLPLNLHKQFWDLFPDSSIVIPRGYKADDLDDIPGATPAAIFNEIKNAGKWKEFIHAYLAGLAYADYNMGIVLEALNKSLAKNNTIICFMGDHGWQLGEKSRFCKYAYYDQAHHTTLIIYDPSAPGNGKVCKKVVSMQDLYPTLLELCNLPVKTDVEGRSLAPLLQNPERTDWDWPILMSFNGVHIIKTNEYRLVDDGMKSQLYHTAVDSFEWDNIYSKPENASRITEMRLKLDSMKAIGQEMKSKLLSNNIFKPAQLIIPGIVEAENYDEGADNLTYHDNDTINSGKTYRKDGVDIAVNNDDKGSFCITNIVQGEWLQYTIGNYEKATYNIGFRCKNTTSASQSIKLFVNEHYISSISIAPTNQKWNTFTLENISLDGTGYQRIKLQFEGSSIELNYLQFDKKVVLGGKAYYQNSSNPILKNRNVRNQKLDLDLTYANLQVKIAVYSSSGNLIFKDGVYGEKRDIYSFKNNLSNGIYLLAIDDGEQFIVEKFNVVN